MRSVLRLIYRTVITYDFFSYLATFLLVVNRIKLKFTFEIVRLVSSRLLGSSCGHITTKRLIIPFPLSFSPWKPAQKNLVAPYRSRATGIIEKS